MRKSIKENQYIINRKNTLHAQRYSMRRLASELGVTGQAVNYAINGVTTSLKLHRAICTKLGVSLVEFWPELYGEPVNHQEMDHSMVHYS